MLSKVQNATVDVMIHLTDLISTVRMLDREADGAIIAEVKDVETSAIELLSRIHILRDRFDPRKLDLNATELECLQLSADGKTNDEISEIVQLSEHAVLAYFSAIEKKLSARNRVHAICEAIRLEIIQ